MNSVFPPPANRARHGLPALAVLVLLACAGLLPARAMAANDCWISSLTDVSFGTVGGGGATSSGTLGFTCHNDGPAVRTFRLCMFVNPQMPSGVAPRRLRRQWTEDYLQYDLYADPGASSQLIGSTTSGHGVYSTTITTSATGQTSGTMPFHGRIPAGQTVAAGSFVSQNTAVLRNASQGGTTAPTVAQCAAASAGQASDYFEVYANFANTCFVSSATDLEFGSFANLAAARDQASVISLRCPANTAWRVGLNYGSHASGTTRRMLGPGGNYVTYELYRNTGRTQVWGNTTANDQSGTGNNAIQTLTVHGRVPAQATGSPGTYSDTVTITLTY